MWGCGDDEDPARRPAGIVYKNYTIQKNSDCRWYIHFSFYDSTAANQQFGYNIAILYKRAIALCSSPIFETAPFGCCRDLSMWVTCEDDIPCTTLSVAVKAGMPEDPPCQDWYHHSGPTITDAIHLGGGHCDFAIELDTSGFAVDTNECTYITYMTGEPYMPALGASITDPYAGLIDWTLEIAYNRSNRHDTDIFTNTLDASEWWYIYYEFDTLFRGGEALLTAEPQTEDCIRSFEFSIRATNPDTQTIIDFIEDQEGQWYDKYVARWESGEQNGRWYLQFNEEGALNCNSADVRYTPNWGEDCDTCPGGFGLFQLTRFTDQNGVYRPPNSQELWSWKANAASGCAYLALKQTGADSYMLDSPNGERLRAMDSLGVNDAAVPIEQVENVTFEDGTERHIEHAVAMKRYNGLGIDPRDHGYDSALYDVGNRQYCEFRDELREWRFNRLAYRLVIDTLTHDTALEWQNYVEGVCSMVP
jgi:hypothetical protein